MNKNFIKELICFFSFLIFIGSCSVGDIGNGSLDNDGDNQENVGNTEDGSDDTNDTPTYNPMPEVGGYADPKGVFIINSGGTPSGNGSLTYITPDGEIKTNVYSTINGTELGDNARAISLYGGKLYILCDDENDEGNGTLIICDAATLKKEKVFKNSDFVFDVPASTVNDSYGVGFRDPGNIAVLDENNIFIVDVQGLFRFDSVTGELFLMEGSYGLGNSGRTIESGVSNKKIVLMNGKAYVSTGGFWKSAGILEYERNGKEPSRQLEISTRYTNNGGLAVDNNLNIWYAAYDRSNTYESELIQIDIEGNELSVKSKMEIKGSVDPGYENTSGISINDNLAYFCGNTTIISRLDMEVNKTIKYIDVASDESNAVAMSCNPVINPENNYLYVATNNRKSGGESKNNILIYDCSGSSPVLLNNIMDKTYYVSGIYCMSDFYRLKEEYN